MNIRILVVGNDENVIKPEAEMLKQRGFAAYTGDASNVDEMIEEVKPHVVYFNPSAIGGKTTRIYHSLLKKMRLSRIPVVYTLAEDETYIVNKPTQRKKTRYIQDNIIDSIKLALLDDEFILNKLLKNVQKRTVDLAYM